MSPVHKTFKIDSIASSRAYDDHAGWRCEKAKLSDDVNDKEGIACCDEDAVAGIPASCFNSNKAITFHPGTGLIKSIKIGSGFETRCKIDPNDGSRWCYLESDINGPVLSDSEKTDMLDSLSKSKRVGL